MMNIKEIAIQAKELIYLCGGLATRPGESTKDILKILSVAASDAKTDGFSEVILASGHLPDVIYEYRDVCHGFLKSSPSTLRILKKGHSRSKLQKQTKKAPVRVSTSVTRHGEC